MIWRWSRRLVVALVGLLLIAVGLLYRADIPPETLKAKYANADSEFIRVEAGLDVHVRDQGPADAPVLVLLHGSNSSLHTWEPWVARLKKTYRVITMDLPGHGLTGPHPRDAYFPENSVAVVHAVMQAKQIDRFVLGGNSMGGAISWHYALIHPEKLAGLLLVNAAGAPLDANAKRALPIGFRLALTPVIRDVAMNLTPRSMVETSLKQSVAVQSSVTPDVVDRYWELLRYPGNRRATIVRFALFKNDLAYKKLKDVKIPTLIMWGKEDKLIPVSAAHSFATLLPNDVSVIYEGVGHVPMEEVPDRSARDVLAWLDQLERFPKSGNRFLDKKRDR